MIFTVALCGIFRLVKAETNARRLSSVTSKHVLKIASGKHSNAHFTEHLMIDVAGLFASRALKLPSVSVSANTDLIRDLRIALQLTAIRRIADVLPSDVFESFKTLLKMLTRIYQETPHKRQELVEKSVAALDELLLLVARSERTQISEEFLERSIALRLALAPEAPFPFETIA